MSHRDGRGDGERGRLPAVQHQGPLVRPFESRASEQAAQLVAHVLAVVYQFDSAEPSALGAGPRRWRGLSRRRIGGRVGGLLCGVGGLALDQPVRATAPHLLDDVRQLVREKAAALVAAGRVLARGEDDVAPRSVGVRVEGARGLGGALVRVHAHRAEVVAEARLHEGAARSIERAAAPPSQNVADRGGRRRGRGARRAPLNRVRAGATLFTLAARRRPSAAGALALHRAGGRGHDVLRHVVGLLLIQVAGLTDGELGL